MKAPFVAGVRRWTAGIAVGMLAAAGVATPALAQPLPQKTGPGPSLTVAQALPPLDPDLLHQAISGLPDAAVTGALLDVTGSAGSWAGTSGVADADTGKPVPANARYRIGSVTKVFTTVVALQLVAEHRLDLNQTVQHYLPGELPTSYPPVTVGELLNHTSGLPIETLDAQYGDPQFYVEHRLDYWAPQQVLDSAFTQPMEFAPGTEQHYNGTNTYLAGILIEKVTGHSYADEVNRRITGPLGLDDTRSPAPGDIRLTGPHTHGYVNVNGTLVDVTEQNAWSWAEGGMISSSADLKKFITALFQGKLLPKAQLDDMFTVPDVPYIDARSCTVGPTAGRACFSMGLEATTFPNGVTVWGKSGEVPGYSTAVFATRDLSRLVVYDLTPTGDRDGSEGPYIQNIAAACFDPSKFVPES